MADGQVKDEKMGTEQPDRMFSDIFGSDLEDSDEEADLKSREGPGPVARGCRQRER